MLFNNSNCDFKNSISFKRRIGLISEFLFFNENITVYTMMFFIS